MQQGGESAHRLWKESQSANREPQTTVLAPRTATLAPSGPGILEFSLLDLKARLALINERSSPKRGSRSLSAHETLYATKPSVSYQNSY